MASPCSFGIPVEQLYPRHALSAPCCDQTVLPLLRPLWRVWENGGVSSSEQQPEPVAPEPVETVVGETTVTVRRSPRYFNFMLLGAIVGAILALVLTVTFPENDEFGQAQVFGFLLLAGVTLGVTLGCVVALILDRVIGRTARTAVADRLQANVSGAAEAQDATSDTQHSGLNPTQ